MIGAMWSDKTKVENQQHILLAIDVGQFEQDTMMIGQGKVWGGIAQCETVHSYLQEQQ